MSDTTPATSDCSLSDASVSAQSRGGSSVDSVQQQLSQMLVPLNQLQENLLQNWSEKDDKAKADPHTRHRFTRQAAVLGACQEIIDQQRMVLGACQVIAGHFPEMAEVLEQASEAAKELEKLEHSEEESDLEEERKQELYRRMKARQQWRIREDSAFEAALKSAESRERDRGRGVRPQAQMREQYSPMYYRLQGWQVRQDQDKQTRRHEIQRERHDYAQNITDDVWLVKVLRDLERAATKDGDLYTRRMETARLPEGVKAVFRDNVGQTILEIMRRTGSHAQIIPHMSLESQNGFDSLTLWGTSAQNTAAIKLLPELAHAVTQDDLNASKDLKDYKLNVQETDRFGVPLERQDPGDDKETLPDEADVLMDKWHGSEDYHDLETEDFSDKPETEPSHNELEVEINDYARSPDTPASNEQASEEARPAVVRAVWTPDHSYAVEAVESQLVRFFKPMNHEQGRPSSAKVEFGRPAIHDVATFAAYVEDMTTQASRLLRRRMQTGEYQPGSPQVHTALARVTENIVSVFTDPAYMSFVSTEAVDTALKLLVKSREFPAVRRIFGGLESNEAYSVTASSFDILLAVAAKEEDIHNFRYMLRLMLKRKIKPTWRTWVRLHDLVSRRFPFSAATNIANKMQDKGILANPQAMRETVANGVQAELSAHLASRPDASLDDFVSLYDGRYAGLGREYNTRHATAEQPRMWLGPSTANRMIKVLLWHGRMQDALAIVQKLEAAGENAKTDTLNMFLSSASRARDAEAAVAALRYFEPMMDREHRPIRLDHKSYAALFHIAWRKRWFNMLRVIWRYACCAGMVSWPMQNRIKQSLMSYVPAPGSWAKREEQRVSGEARQAVRDVRKGARKTDASDEAETKDGMKMTRHDVFFGWAGKFAIGVQDELLSLTRPSSDPLSLTHHELEVLSLSAQPRSRNPASIPEGDDSAVEAAEHALATHRERRKRLLALIEADLSEIKSLRPTVPFVEMLEKAWQKDVRWKARGLGQNLTDLEPVSDGNDSSAAEEERAKHFAKMFEEMLAHGIRIPMVVGDVGRERPRH